MRYLYLFLFSVCLLMSVNLASAQLGHINCDSLCVTDISLSNSQIDMINIVLYNGDSNLINYPIVMIIYNGDTVANREKRYYYYGHMGKSSLVHQVQTTLTNIPNNFTCKVVVIDPVRDDTCIIDYPCSGSQPAGINIARVSNSFKLYPNPAKQFLYIDFNSSKHQETLQIRIFSSAGTEVFSGNISALNNYLLDVNILPRGMYFLKLYNGQTVEVQKFLKD